MTLNLKGIESWIDAARADQTLRTADINLWKPSGPKMGVKSKVKRRPGPRSRYPDALGRLNGKGPK